MSLPGFTAEASFHKMKKRYQGVPSFPRPNKALYPAQWEEGGGVDIGPLDIGYPKYAIVPPGQEEAFYACIKRCRAAGGTYSTCQRSCCRQVTGFDSCYIA
jgi:hypothetical protein